MISYSGGQHCPEPSNTFYVGGFGCTGEEFLLRECRGLHFSNPSCDPGHCVKLVCDTTYSVSDDEDDDDLFSTIEINSKNKLKKNTKK